MNLFVVGPQALSDWILQIIEEAKDQLLRHTPPIDLNITLDVGRADAVVYQADERERIDLGEADDGVARLCIATPGSKVPRAANETLLFRAGPECSPVCLAASFEEAIKALFLQCHLHSLQRTLSGPFSHDIRGALSVVSLSRQLLESGGGGKLVAERLGRVDSRIAMALLDIEARSLCLSGDWPPSTAHAQIGAPLMEEISDWFKRTQGERELEINVSALEEMRRAPAWAALALSGCIDGVTRLTRGKVEIARADHHVHGSFCVRVAGEQVTLDEIQLRSLDEPQRWALMSHHMIPYRLGTAALLVGSAGGSVLASVRDERLMIEIRLP